MTMTKTSGANRCPVWHPPVPHRDLIHTAMTPCSGWATFISILVWLHAVAVRKYMYLQDTTPPVVKFYNYYVKYFKYGRCTWTPPGKWNIEHRYFAPSTGCTNVASDEFYACVYCCSLCNPHPTANITPEIVHNTDVSKEIVPRQCSTVATLYRCHMKVTPPTQV